MISFFGTDPRVGFWVLSLEFKVNLAFNYSTNPNPKSDYNLKIIVASKSQIPKNNY
jgi:hypothetical protein